MIEVSNKNVESYIYFPKTSKVNESGYTLRIHSELSQKNWTFSVVDAASLADYYKFLLDLYTVDDGEMVYYISVGDDVIDSGLIRIGIPDGPDTRQYQDEPEIIQYDAYTDPIGRYQNKSVSYSANGEYNVVADQGYDALKQVNITVDVQQEGMYELTVKIASDTLSGLTGNATVTVRNDSGYSNSKVYDGEDLVFNLNPGASYVVEYSTVEGYITPAEYYLNTTWSGQMTLHGYYDTDVTSRNYFCISDGSTGGLIVYWHGPSEHLTEEKTLEYWHSGLSGWQRLKQGKSAAVYEPGGTLYFRGQLDSCNQYHFEILDSNQKMASLAGNIMSLLDTADFEHNTMIASDRAFASLFSKCDKIKYAENLVLPATTLASECYYGMFQNCTSLTTAPELPATTLQIRCYCFMFQKCTSLNYIKCMATNISAVMSTFRWVNGITSSGTFVKDPSMNDWTTGDDGIPNNWTVQDAE